MQRTTSKGGIIKSNCAVVKKDHFGKFTPILEKDLRSACVVVEALDHLASLRPEFKFQLCRNFEILLFTSTQSNSMGKYS